MHYRDRYKLAIVITIAVPSIEGSLAYFYTHSHSLLGSALHMILHVIPLFTGYWSLRSSVPEERKKRLEEFTTWFNVLLLWGLAAVILVRGVVRYFEPVAILWDETMVLAGFEIAANIGLMRLMQGLGHAHIHAHTAHGQMRCFLQDALAGAGVLLGAIIGKTFDYIHADLLASAVVLGATVWYALELSHELNHNHPHAGHH